METRQIELDHPPKTLHHQQHFCSNHGEAVPAHNTNIYRQTDPNSVRTPIIQYSEIEANTNQINHHHVNSLNYIDCSRRPHAQLYQPAQFHRRTDTGFRQQYSSNSINVSPPSHKHQLSNIVVNNNHHQILIEQNKRLTQSLQYVEKILHDNQQIMERLYQQIRQKDGLIEKLRHLYREPMENSDKSMNVITLTNELGEARLKMNHMEQELIDLRQKYSRDSQNFMRNMQEKNQQVLGAKRKLNDILQIKRRLEESLDSYDFQLRNIRSKLETEIREKNIKMENLQRIVSELVGTHKNEIAQLQQIIRGKDEEIAQQRVQLNNLRNTQHDSARELLEAKRRQQKEFEILQADFKNRHASPEVAAMRKQASLPAIRYDVKSIHNNKNNPESVPMGNSFLSPQKYNSPSTANQKQMSLMEDFYGDSKSKNYYEEEAQSATSSKNNQQKEQKYNKHGLFDISVVKQGIVQSLFKRFCACVTEAQRLNKNALIVFLQSLKDTIYSIKPSVDDLQSSTPTLQFHPHLYNNQYFRQSPHTTDTVSNRVNAWTLDTLKFTLQQFEKNNHEANKEELLVFRLLTIKYRVRYPHKGRPVMLEQAVETALDHNIIAACIKLLRKYS